VITEKKTNSEKVLRNKQINYYTVLYLHLAAMACRVAGLVLQFACLAL
jgi:hypothetical protein